jgi:hypothetical protein
MRWMTAARVPGAVAAIAATGAASAQQAIGRRAVLPHSGALTGSGEPPVANRNGSSSPPDSMQCTITGQMVSVR